MRLAIVSFAALAAFALPTGRAVAEDSEREFRPMAVGSLVGRFRPITDFPVISATDSDLADNELVIGVTQGDAARAYPINMLTGPRREILNDTLGGRAIAATW
jgi:hypothetical protein